jgi:tripartite-type tricarboxylate transporter receptor subunit TctC
MRLLSLARAAVLAGATFVSLHGWTSERALRLMVPTPAGTSADVMARILAEHMGGTLGVPIVVENKPGASGAIAVESVLQRGGTRPGLLLAGLDHIVYGPAALGRKPWDPVTDLKPVGLVNNDRWVVIGHPASAGDMAGLLRTARERPLLCANGGLGTTQHAICALVAKRLGVRVEHVPYSQAFMPDLIAGRVDLAAVPLPGAAAALGGGRVRGVMLLSQERHPAFAGIPTGTELLQRGPVFESGLAMYAAPDTTDAEVERLHDALQRAQSDEAVRKRLVDLGVEPAPASRAEALRQLRMRIRLNEEIRQEALGAPR